MRKRWTTFFIFIVFGFITSNSILAVTSQSPVSMIQSVANRLTARLAQHKATLRSRRADQFIHQQVNVIIVPKVNVKYMAQSVVGRYYWNQATPSQRQAFIREFKRLVISNYSAALASYNDDRVKVYPLRTSTWKTSPIVTVKSVIIRKNGQTIPINYILSKTNGSWRINDFSIENVSMIGSYRSQFAGTLSQGGLAHLLTEIRSRNV